MHNKQQSRDRNGKSSMPIPLHRENNMSKIFLGTLSVEETKKLCAIYDAKFFFIPLPLSHFVMNSLTTNSRQRCPLWGTSSFAYFFMLILSVYNKRKKAFTGGPRNSRTLSVNSLIRDQ